MTNPATPEPLAALAVPVSLRSGCSLNPASAAGGISFGQRQRRPLVRIAGCSVSRHFSPPLGVGNEFFADDCRALVFNFLTAASSSPKWQPDRPAISRLGDCCTKKVFIYWVSI